MRFARRIARRVLPDPLPPLPPGLSPVLARVYAARQVSGPLELDYSLARLHPFAGLGGIGTAARLLADALAAGDRLLVVGDYDADVEYDPGPDRRITELNSPKQCVDAWVWKKLDGPTTAVQVNWCFEVT